jgi:polyphosphate kinase
MAKRYFNRDLSWLSFNYRVLQEAKDLRVPLYERMKFLAIFSSNLEEFYRIRVAEWKRLEKLTKKTKKELKEDPAEVLRKINKTVLKYQEEFHHIFWEQIVNELEAQDIYILNEKILDKEQELFVREFFKDKVQPIIKPIFIHNRKTPPILDDHSIYLAVKLHDHNRLGRKIYEYAVVEVPSKRLSRFLVLPEKDDQKFVMILGDIIRLNLQDLFPDYEILECYSIKLTRDAELVLEDEFSGSLLKKIKKGLHNRDKGLPTRLSYDKSMPSDFLRFLRRVFGIGRLDILPGGRYHNFSDLFTFPKLMKGNVFYENLPTIRVEEIDDSVSIFDAIRKKDYLLHFPYMSYDYVIRFLDEAANDPAVRAIKITLYRVANNSKVVAALVKAVNNGKKVTAFIELKARFDEETNIENARALEEAGVKVLYSFPILKVHAKMILIERTNGERLERFTYLSTGNFNEATSRLYGDSSLFTHHKYMCREVSSVFDILGDTRIKKEFSHLMVAPDHMRHDLYTLIDTEIKNALKGKDAWMTLKMNSLQDPLIIEKLYEASCEGVKINLIIRGICCLIPGVKDQSENIKIISIVDRFLEHSRVFIFCNDGKSKVFLSSADWMTRNLSRRYEVGFPIYDEELKQEMIDLVNIQWKDNTKARVINKIQNNTYRKSTAKQRVRSQISTHRYLKEKYKKIEVKEANSFLEI